MVRHAPSTNSKGYSVLKGGTSTEITLLVVFATGPLHDDPDEFAQARTSVENALRRVHGVEPCEVQVFGGSLEPDDHRFPFNRMERADARDWDAIRAWARALPERLLATAA